MKYILCLYEVRAMNGDRIIMEPREIKAYSKFEAIKKYVNTYDLSACDINSIVAIEK